MQSAAFGSRLPLGFGGNNSTSVGVDGYVPRENEEIVINYSTIGPKYFETMGVPIRQGREYNDTDTLQSPRTLVINESDGAALLAGRQRARRHASGSARTSPKSSASSPTRNTAASTSGRCRSCSSRCRAAKSARCGCS